MPNYQNGPDILGQAQAAAARLDIEKERIYFEQNNASKMVEPPALEDIHSRLTGLLSHCEVIHHQLAGVAERALGNNDPMLSPMIGQVEVVPMVQRIDDTLDTISREMNRIQIVAERLQRLA